MNKNMKIGTIVFMCVAMVFFAACKKKKDKKKCPPQQSQEVRVCKDNSNAVYSQESCSLVCPEDKQTTVTETNTATATTTETNTQTVTSTVQ